MRLASYNRTLNFYSDKMLENKSKLQLTLAQERLADSIVGQESYPLLAQQAASTVFASPLVQQVGHSILNYNSARFEFLRLEIE